MSTYTTSTANSRSNKTSRFYQRILDESLNASSGAWLRNCAYHGFALSFGEGKDFRKHFFYIEAQHIERFIHLAIECGVGEDLLDRNTVSSVEADIFPSQRCERLGWLFHEDAIPTFPAQITLRQFLLARQYDVPAAYTQADELTQDLYRRGIAIPHTVAEYELARVDAKRKQETEPYILEENVSHAMQRAYGTKPKNAAGQPCNQLSEAKKRQLYAKRFLHRFPIGTGVYLPATPERVMAMVAVFDELVLDCMDISFAYRSSLAASTGYPLLHFLQYTVTDRNAANRFPCQDVHCLKWQQADCAPSKDDTSKISLGRFLELQGYLQAGWEENFSGSLAAIRR